MSNKIIFLHSKEIPLWPSEPVLHQTGSSVAELPTITPFFPPVWKSNGKALIIFPGGGYVDLAEHEGRGYAEYFASQGFHCFVVKYRLGGKDGIRNGRTKPVPDQTGTLRHNPVCEMISGDLAWTISWYKGLIIGAYDQ